MLEPPTHAALLLQLAASFRKPFALMDKGAFRTRQGKIRLPFESIKIRGRSGSLLELGSVGFSEARIPALEGLVQFVVQDLGSRLQQQMRPFFAPLHLLFLHHPLGGHLVHGGFDEA